MFSFPQLSLSLPLALSLSLSLNLHPTSPNSLIATSNQFAHCLAWSHGGNGFTSSFHILYSNGCNEGLTLEEWESKFSQPRRVDKPEQLAILEPLEMGNQPPAVPPHQNLISANQEERLPKNIFSPQSQESMTPVSSYSMTIAKSPLPTTSVMRRPAPRPPVNTSQRSSPPPLITMAETNSISQSSTTVANGIAADPLKDDSIEFESLSTFTRIPSSQLSTDSSIPTFNPKPPLPRLPIQLLPSLEEENSQSTTLSKIPEEDDSTSQASTVVVVQAHHQPQQQQQQRRSSNSPTASVSTTSSSTTLPLSSSPQRTRSPVHTTPTESLDTEGEELLDKLTQRPKKTSKRDGKGLTKRRKAFRWGSHQGTDKNDASTPSSEDDVDNTDRSKQSSSTPVPQNDLVSHESWVWKCAVCRCGEKLEKSTCVKSSSSSLFSFKPTKLQSLPKVRKKP
ncbi:unnamed protein product [Rodentolepis nana]|uniref:CW-type domain-containing protein n=1 Tax=Rodentolepis nana TaxID=102285 RepID=A0A158QJD4_RODNA|nr:unnamed protein product [Rodentolepis nana]